MSRSSRIRMSWELLAQCLSRIVGYSGMRKTFWGFLVEAFDICMMPKGELSRRDTCPPVIAPINGKPFSKQGASMRMRA